MSKWKGALRGPRPALCMLCDPEAFVLDPRVLLTICDNCKPGAFSVLQMLRAKVAFGAIPDPDDGDNPEAASLKIMEFLYARGAF